MGSQNTDWLKFIKITYYQTCIQNIFEYITPSRTFRYLLHFSCSFFWDCFSCERNCPTWMRVTAASMLPGASNGRSWSTNIQVVTVFKTKHLKWSKPCLVVKVVFYGISLGEYSMAKKNSPRPTAHPKNSCFSAKVLGPGCLPHRPTWAPCACHSHNLGNVKVQRPKPTVDEMFQILTNDINLQPVDHDLDTPGILEFWSNLQQLGWWSGYTWNLQVTLQHLEKTQGPHSLG